MSGRLGWCRCGSRGLLCWLLRLSRLRWSDSLLRLLRDRLVLLRLVLFLVLILEVLLIVILLVLIVFIIVVSCSEDILSGIKLCLFERLIKLLAAGSGNFLLLGLIIFIPDLFAIHKHAFVIVQVSLRLKEPTQVQLSICGP